MRITVMGASGQIGSKVVELLTAAGHDVVGASLRTGANVLTGEGLDEAVAAADVAATVADAAQGAPVNGILNVGGPDKMAFAELARTVVAHRGAVLGDLRFSEWLASR